MSVSTTAAVRNWGGQLSARRKRAGVFAFCLLLGSLPRTSNATDVVEVEGQPLAQNVLRVLQSLETLGQPLPAKLSNDLQAAAKAEDAEIIQKLLGPATLAEVHINPESRVKVQRGLAKADIQQSGFTAFLVRIQNEADTTNRLRVRSPQAGPAYGGASRFILARQAQTSLIDDEQKTDGPRRFLNVAIHSQAPMTDQLSGLAVEYRILLVYCSEAGKRDATLEFDVGQGTEDIGFRGELAVLFRSRQSNPVTLRIRDENGQPSTARLEFTDRQGRVYPPQARRIAPDFFFQRQVYRHDGETVLLPAGRFLVQSSRGPEYIVNTQQFVVSESDPQPELTIHLERWVNPLSFGYASGDHHIHAAGCSHYTMPTEGVLPADMFRQVKGEGLNVGCVLTWGPCYDYQRQFFGMKAHALSEPHTILKYDLEISGFGSQALGHVCLLNLQNQTYPGSEETKTAGWPTWTTPVMRWAKKQGGVTGYAHSASGLWIDAESASRRLMARWDTDKNGRLTTDESAAALLPAAFGSIDRDRDLVLSETELVESHLKAADELPNLAIPEMNGVGAMEICVAMSEGVCDFISAMDTRRIQEWNTWYHILNCGFPLKVSGETDFPCMSSTRVGQGRVYVRMDDTDNLDFSEWCNGLRRGRSYVSDGYAHALEFSVNGTSPGDEALSLKSGESIDVKAKVCFAPETPIAIAHGTLESARFLQGDTVNLHGPRVNDLAMGGQRKIELIVNGKVIRAVDVAADGKLHDISFNDVEIPRSSWVAIRQFPQLHTNPVTVLVDEKPIRASRESARWCVEVIDLLWKNRERNIRPDERDEARAAFDRARIRYQQIASECPEGS